MGTHAGFDANAFGPFGSLFESYFATIQNSFAGADIQTVSQQMTAPLKASARCQLELLGLGNRRAQAYMQMPTRLAQCRTPQDVMNEQMAFWRTATEQYRDCALKVGQAWGQALPWLPSAGRGQSADRDYITFNNGSGRDGSVPAPRSDRAGGHRRVA